MNFGCAVGGACTSFIAGGMAYYALLVESGRQRQILPFIGKVYTGGLWRSSKENN